jgi:hypothetical protein
MRENDQGSWKKMRHALAQLNISEALFLGIIEEHAWRQQQPSWFKTSKKVEYFHIDLIDEIATIFEAQDNNLGTEKIDRECYILDLDNTHFGYKSMQIPMLDDIPDIMEIDETKYPALELHTTHNQPVRIY